MRIAVASSGNTLDSPVDPRFGRCPWFVIVDPDTMSFEALANPAAGAQGGAGIQAAQTLLGQRLQALIAGSIGPNAFHLLAAGGVAVVPFTGGTVRQAVEAYTRGDLETIAAPTTGLHGGMGAPAAGTEPVPASASLASAAAGLLGLRGRRGLGRGPCLSGSRGVDGGRGLGVAGGPGMGRGVGRGMGRGRGPSGRW